MAALILRCFMQFDWSVSVGSIGSAVLALMAFGAFYHGTKNDIGQLKNTIASILSKIELFGELMTADAVAKQQLAHLEARLDRLEVTIEGLRRGDGYIEKRPRG